MPANSQIDKEEDNQPAPSLQRRASLGFNLPIFGSVQYEVSSIDNAVERLSRASPSDVQEIAASQIELLSTYHKLVISQAQRSFIWGLIAAGIGLTFFITAVSFLLVRTPAVQEPANAAIVSVISGALIEIISGINFYLYSKASLQLAEFQTRLDVTQRFLLANSLCEALEGELKHQSRAELIRKIAGVEVHSTDSNPQQTVSPDSD